MMRTPTSFLLTCFAVAIASPADAQSVKAGIEAWQRGDHAAAVAIWRPLANQGNADAAFNLGQAYRLGRGVEIDLGQAQRWLERAARNGHVDAQVTLGLLLFDNGNRIAGLRWLKGAAENGEPRAMLVYGTALYNGDGVPSDPVLAYAYVSRSAAQGLAPAKVTLAQMDSVMPIEQRRKGVALALDKAKSPVAEKPVTPKPKPAPAKKAEIETKAPAPAAQKPSVAPSKPKAGQWRIQLGAFSKKESAQALYKQLAGKAPVAGRDYYLVAAGSVTRLQIGPFESKSAANSACTALKARGQPCFPVGPN